MTDKQRAAVETAAQRVLAVRAEFLADGAPVSDPARIKKRSQRAGSEIGAPSKTATVADLYDPLARPPALVKAHADFCSLLLDFIARRLLFHRRGATDCAVQLAKVVIRVTPHSEGLAWTIAWVSLKILST